MNRFRALAVVVQIIVGEFDADGDLIAEHAQPPTRLLKPLGLSVEQQAQLALQQLREAKETEERNYS